MFHNCNTLHYVYTVVRAVSVYVADTLSWVSHSASMLIERVAVLSVGQLQRMIGLKVLEMGGNAVIG